MATREAKQAEAQLAKEMQAANQASEKASPKQLKPIRVKAKKAAVIVLKANLKLKKAPSPTKKVVVVLEVKIGGDKGRGVEMQVNR